MFLTALALFTVASGLCAMAWDVGSLVAFRVVQGVRGGVPKEHIMLCGYWRRR